ncbi:hypothetical protein Acor_10420 [Acrocarpospora corrugata]|uniref:Lipoprotein n=1 Tax=Acrocarpospora corrugata TaxID=35763 RepID=A0A5M3VS00_9ACTN|nr:hypothetical protein [Acrocarpospora corrugata]GER98978.1 hypothetical protein Acor_10420 [Acrocarpospora corrugata]
MKIRILVALAVMLAAVFGVQGAAQAEYGHGDSIRYASAKGCVKKGGDILPCGTWRLVTHHGRVILLKDAQVRALDKKGHPMTRVTAPVAVSGNGQKVAYFRKDGRLAVRSLDGKVRLLPENALPSRTAQYDVTLQLSDDGAVVAVTAGRTKLFDTALGRRLGQLPKGRYFLGFSGDGAKELDWTGEYQVTLHASKMSKSARIGMTVLQQDVRSGATTIRDKYELLKDTFVYASCGG